MVGKVNKYRSTKEGGHMYISMCSLAKYNSAFLQRNFEIDGEINITN